MNRTILVFAAAVLLTTFAQAQDANMPGAASTLPKSPEARQAETKFNLDMQKLDADYLQKANAIKQSYVDNLKTALKTLATRNDVDPDEIARLSAKIKEVQATIIHANYGQAAPAVAAVVQPRVSGRWRHTWPGGSGVVIFQGNKRFEQDGSGGCPFVQDGNNIAVLIGGGYDAVTLSNDGKSMTGNFSDGKPVTYTYLGN